MQSLALVLILWDVFRTRTAIHAGLQAYVLGAYVAVGGAIANCFGSNPFYTSYDRFSPGATNPDGFGFIIALGIPVAWYLAGTPCTARWRRILKPLDFAFIPAAFIGPRLADAHGGRRRHRRHGVRPGLAHPPAPDRADRDPRVLTYAFFALLPVVQPLASFQRLGTTANEATEGDLNGRLSQWSQGLDSFHEHPLVGVGANMYRTVNTLGKEAHNSFVSVLVSSA